MRSRWFKMEEVNTKTSYKHNNTLNSTKKTIQNEECLFHPFPKLTLSKCNYYV